MVSIDRLSSKVEAGGGWLIYRPTRTNVLDMDVDESNLSDTTNDSEVLRDIKDTRLTDDDVDVNCGKSKGSSKKDIKKGYVGRRT